MERNKVTYRKRTERQSRYIRAPLRFHDTQETNYLEAGSEQRDVAREHVCGESARESRTALPRGKDAVTCLTDLL